MLDRDEPIAERYKGRWRDILSHFESGSFLSGKHGPCPFCGGKDRFRFTNYQGHGDWWCNQCGKGDGVEFVMRSKVLSCREALARIEEIAGTARVETPRPRKTEPEARKALNAVWRCASPVTAGDPVAQYLEARVGPLGVSPACLRTVASLPYWDGDVMSNHPAMVAKVTGPDGKPANIHRTYLTGDGRKADVASPKKMMAGSLPKGSAVRLMDVVDGRIGICEGIETALAASVLFGVSCWSAVGSSMLAAWIPPVGVREVIIFGDNDLKYGGHAAAFTLAHRLACNEKFPITVEVKITPTQGTDWADVLAERRVIAAMEAA